MKPVFDFLNSAKCDVVKKYADKNKKILHNMMVTSLDLCFEKNVI